MRDARAAVKAARFADFSREVFAQYEPDAGA
jgi:hypothetical protein